MTLAEHAYVNARRRQDLNPDDAAAFNQRLLAYFTMDLIQYTRALRVYAALGGRP